MSDVLSTDVVAVDTTNVLAADTADVLSADATVHICQGGYAETINILAPELFLIDFVIF